MAALPAWVLPFYQPLSDQALLLLLMPLLHLKIHLSQLLT
jgi:hypothetical protein